MAWNELRARYHGSQRVERVLLRFLENLIGQRTIFASLMYRLSAAITGPIGCDPAATVDG